MAFIFDTDAISEVLRPKPLPLYLEWLRTVPADEQFTTAINVGELTRGAWRSSATERHLRNLEERVFRTLQVLPFDDVAARQFGQMKARLASMGTPLADADLQIAAITVVHGHELVTGNLKHFSRIPGLRLNTALSAARPEM